MSRSFSRRAFLKTSGAAAGGVALGVLGCSDRSLTTRRLQSELSGRLVLPKDEEYDSARRIWNGLIDRQPWAVAKCASSSDVQRCVAFARESGLPVSVRGGGHHAAGFAIAENGLVIDLSELTEIEVDASTGTARVGPGVRAGPLHRITQEHGLVLPTGGDPTVGVAGLTLGGGEGWLAAKYGLTCDNLVAATVVNADGDLVQAGENQDSDLLWGLRGGGGNLGIATSFRYRLHPLTSVVAGFLSFPGAQGREMIRHWRDEMATAPDDLGSMILFVQTPDPTFLLGVSFAGSEAAVGHVLDSIRRHGQPLADGIRKMPVLDLFSPEPLTPGACNYWRSHYMREMNDEAIDMFVDYCVSATSEQTSVWMWHYHGAFSRVPATATAYPHRDATFEMGILARWSASRDGDPHVAWAREFWVAMKPFATGGVYSNWLSDIERGTSAAAYGVNLPRLAQLKQRYDPSNLFCANVNVQPSG